MMTYEWVKVAHLLSVISWMAGLLYLPRLMVYHAGAVEGGELSETLKVMERRLLKAIMTPAMIASWVFGIWLGAMQGYWSELPLWFVGKVVLVLAMSAAHGWLGVQVKQFAAGCELQIRQSVPGGQRSAHGADGRYRGSGDCETVPVSELFEFCCFLKPRKLL